MERPEENNHLKELDIDGEVLLKWIFKKWDGEACTALICLRIRTGDGLL